MLLQFTWSRTSGQLSDMSPSVAGTCSYLALSSVSHLPGFFVVPLPSASVSPLSGLAVVLLRSAIFLFAVEDSLRYPSSGVRHFMLSVDPPTSSPLTIAYRFPRCLFPLPFRCTPPPPKSSSSIQLFGSTKVSPTAFATQSSLSFRLPIRLHDTSLRLNTPLSTSLQFGIFFAVDTNAYTSPIMKSRFLVYLRSFVPKCIISVSAQASSLLSITLFNCSVFIPGKHSTFISAWSVPTLRTNE